MIAIRTIFLCLVLLSPIQVIAEILDQKEIADMKKEIKSMYDAFNSGDASLIFKKTHSSVYGLVGGKENFERITKEGIAETKAQGINEIQSELGEPTRLYNAGNEEVSFVPRVTVMKVEDSTIKNISYLIAIRKKGTTNWLYLDGSGFRKDQSLLWMLLPKLDRNICIPPSYLEMY